MPKIYDLISIAILTVRFGIFVRVNSLGSTSRSGLLDNLYPLSR